MDKTKYNSLCDAVIGKTFGDLTVTHISKLYAHLKTLRRELNR